MKLYLTQREASVLLKSLEANYRKDLPKSAEHNIPIIELLYKLKVLLKIK